MTEQALDRIAKTKAYLYDSLKQSTFFEKHPAKLDYRYQHSLRTAAYGQQIARTNGLDEEALVLGCLLHDISYSREFTSHQDWLDHGRESARMARPWLLQLGLEPQLVEEICYGIAIHVDDKSDFEGPRTPLSENILMCDNIDRFDCYRIYEVLENAQFSQMHYDEQLQWLEKQFPHLEGASRFAYGSPTAIRLWREKAALHLEFYKKLYAQLKLGDTVGASAPNEESDGQRIGGQIDGQGTDSQSADGLTVAGTF